MYLCLDCGKLFEESKPYADDYGVRDLPYYHWDGCPVCSGAYVETYECDVCGEWIVDGYIELDDGTRICDNCYIVRHIDG